MLQCVSLTMMWCLVSCQLRDLDKVEVRSFEYAKYPKWWDINVERGHYGWKPEVYNDVLRESLVTTMW